MNRNGLSYERHVEVAEELRDIYEWLVALEQEIDDHYDVVGIGGRTRRLAERATGAVANLRHHLSDQLQVDHPGRYRLDIYLPPRT